MNKKAGEKEGMKKKSRKVRRGGERRQGGWEKEREGEGKGGGGGERRRGGRGRGRRRGIKIIKVPTLHWTL